MKGRYEILNGKSFASKVKTTEATVGQYSTEFNLECKVRGTLSY